MHHQEAAVGVHRDVSFTPDNLLGGVVTPCFSRRSFHRLTVNDGCRRAGLTPRTIAVEHQFDVVDRLEQEATRKLAKPAVDRAPAPEVSRQHAPATARTNQIADRVDDLTKFYLARRSGPVPGRSDPHSDG